MLETQDSSGALLPLWTSPACFSHITDSVSCNFIVKYRASPGQCSVNGKPLLHFDDGKQEGNAPEVCADLLQSLKDIFEKMTNLESGLFKSKGKSETEWEKGRTEII